MTGCPPGPERVLEQEADHVVLGEELRHRAEVGAADLALGGVHLVLLLALPVLVDPAKAIVRGEDLLRERFHDRLEREPRLRREPKPDTGIVEAEDPRQDLGREASGHSPRIGLVQLGGELGALGQRHRRPVLGVDQQPVLGEEASEEQAVPLLVGALREQQLDRLTLVSQLPALRPQPATEILLVVRQMGRRLRLDHPEATELGAATLLRSSPPAHTGVLESLPQVGGEGGHRNQAARARPLLGEREVEVVEALGAVGVLAAILVPVDVELGAQDAGLDEGTDVEADTVVEVGVPAKGLLGERLPAHEDVVGRLALEDQREAALEIACGEQASLGPGRPRPGRQPSCRSIQSPK